ncbi:MAG: TonB-dependent receptor [Bacteroidetes bacterium]|nr:TonB-dependent receptor [Bacteroidota bacterium]
MSTGALTGSGSVIFYPRSDTKFSVIISTGYRAPNVDDFGKVRAKDQEVTLPGNSLKPEYAFNAEFGAEKTFGGVVSTGFNVYYTLLTNAIVSAYSTYNGKDSLNYNGDMYRIVTNTNSDKAYITGASVFLNVKLNEKFGLENTINYTYGRDKSNDVPLAHIPPVFGKSSINFEKKIFQSELYVAYHGWKRKENYGSGSEDNLNYATVYGAPSWATLNLNTVTKLGKHLQLQLAIENIFDTYYRVFCIRCKRFRTELHSFP